MNKVLYIKANPKTEEESYTFKMSEAFIDEYKTQNPNDKVDVLDLYQSDVDFLRQEDMPALVKDYSGEHKLRDHAKNFAGYNKYIIAAPMWNFGTPAILKAYIDYVLLAGVAFEYTPEGPKGLFAGQSKKMTFITARGGQGYDGAMKDFNFSNTHLQAVFGFIGIEDFQTIAFEGSAMPDAEERFPKTLEDVKQKASHF